MTWIFQQCVDPYGRCIRQYCSFGVSILIFIFCAYSVIMTIRKQHHYTFQLIPLAINTAATLSLLAIFTQFQQQNIYLTILVIQIYTYSLLTYSYVGLYLLGTKKISQAEFRKITVGFVGFTVVAVLAIIGLIALQVLGKLKCAQTHGIGNLILSLLEVPLYIITFTYVTKTKRHIKQMQQSCHKNQQNISAIKLLGNQDEYIKIKYYQANMVLIFFSLSIIVHTATVIMFFTVSTGCSQQSYIYTDNIYEVIMFSLFDFAAILPHLAIPIILYYIPAFHLATNDVITITPKLITKEKSQYENLDTASQFYADRITKMVRKNTGNSGKQ